jgi:D-alanine--poly(phosphoribitol) ligase subunit 1
MKTLSTLLEVGLAVRPEAEALVTPGLTFTFADLERRSNAVALLLAERMGVGPGDRVVILAEKSPAIVIAALALWKLGAVYVPIDTDNPPGRTERIVRNVEPRVLISSERRLALLGDGAGGVRRFAYEGLLELDAAPPGRSTPPPAIHPEAPAVIIHTSGSTGEPKGAVLSHGSVTTYFANHNEHLRFDPASRTLNNGPFHFDVSIQDTFLPLYFGASVVLHTDLFVSSVMIRLILRQQVTHLIAVSSILDLIARDREGLKALAGSALHTVVTGGEVCSPQLINLLLETVPGLRALYGYGPTECNSLCMTHEISAPELERTELYPIGKPFSGMKAVLLDADGGVIQAAGEVGVLAMSGPQLMTGYFGDPQHTGRVLRTIESERYYVTGDLCFRDAMGDYHFAGRNDSEVKLRGRRINLNEVRAALLRHDRVRYVAVSLVEVLGEAKIVAFVQVDEPQRFPVGELDALLERHVPRYMIPSYLCMSAHVMRTSTGKVSDRETMAGVVQRVREKPTERLMVLE